MIKRKRATNLPDRTNNIWNRYDFAMCGLGEKNILWAKIKHFKKCLRWSKQRVVRGYSDSDIWNMYGYLQTLLPDMLQNLKDNRHGSPGFLGENYTNAEGVVVNDTCHTEWDKLLERMIFLWKEIVNAVVEAQFTLCMSCQSIKKYLINTTKGNAS